MTLATGTFVLGYFVGLLGGTCLGVRLGIARISAMKRDGAIKLERGPNWDESPSQARR